MGSLSRIAGLVVKELLALLKDRRARIVLVAPPLVQLFIFAYAATFDVHNVAMVVDNRDGGAESRALVSRFAGSETFEAVAAGDRSPAAMVRSRRADMILRIPDDFTRKFQRGLEPEVQVLADGRNSNTAAIILQYASAIVTDFNRARSKGPGQTQLAVRAWFNPNLVSRWFILPGLVGVLALVITTIVTALSVAREREEGTFNQLLVTPLRPPEILLGKAIPGILIGLFEATLMLILARTAFGVPFQGGLGLLYAGLSLFLLSAVGVGLLISSLCRTQQQALLGAFLFMVPAVILSGFATPIANMPAAVQYLTYLNPLRYCLTVIRGVYLRDAPFEVLVHQFWPMAVIGVVSLAAAALLFRRRLG